MVDGFLTVDENNELPEAVRGQLSATYGLYTVMSGKDIDPTGGVDSGPAIQAKINSVLAFGGGTVFFQTGTYRIDQQLIFPDDGGAIAGEQPPLRITGAGADNHLYRTGKGTTLDLRYAGADAKIFLNKRGLVEIDHLTLTDNGVSTTPFILATNTVTRIHDNLFLGNPSKQGVTCDQDAVIYGGTTVTVDETPAGGFQGYGSVLKDNGFAKIRKCATLRVWANSIVIRDNIVVSDCGAPGEEAPIEIDPTAHVDGFAWGNVISGNLIQMNNYKVGLRGRKASRNFFSENAFWDQHADTWIADYYFTDSSSGNMIQTGGVEGQEPKHYVTEAGSGGNAYVGVISRDSIPGLDLSGPLFFGNRTPSTKATFDAPVLLAGNPGTDGLQSGVVIQPQGAVAPANSDRLMQWKNHPSAALGPGAEIAHLLADGRLRVLAPYGGKVQTSQVEINNGGLKRYSGNGLDLDPAGGDVMVKQNGLQINSNGNGVTQYSGAGAPALSALVGDAYWRADGGAGQWLYKCTVSGVAATTSWTAVL